MADDNRFADDNPSDEPIEEDARGGAPDSGSDTRAVIEAVLFVAEAPVPAKELAEVLEIATDGVEEVLRTLAGDLDERGSGLALREVAGGWRLYARPSTYPYLERYATTPTASRLSAAALEVLAVVAYKQPISRGQIGEIRGVESDSSLRTLERKGLVKEIERLPLPGNPAVYGTTLVFLEKMGLRSLDELPPLADHVPPASIVETLEESFRPNGD